MSKGASVSGFGVGPPMRDHVRGLDRAPDHGKKCGEQLARKPGEREHARTHAVSIRQEPEVGASIRRHARPRTNTSCSGIQIFDPETETFTLSSVTTKTHPSCPSTTRSRCCTMSGSSPTALRAGVDELCRAGGRFVESEIGGCAVLAITSLQCWARFGPASGPERSISPSADGILLGVEASTNIGCGWCRML